MTSLHLRCKVLHLLILLNSAADLDVTRPAGEDAVVLVTYVL